MSEIIKKLGLIVGLTAALGYALVLTDNSLSDVGAIAGAIIGMLIASAAAAFLLRLFFTAINSGEDVPEFGSFFIGVLVFFNIGYYGALLAPIVLSTLAKHL